MKDVYSAAKKLKMERVKQVQFPALPRVPYAFFRQAVLGFLVVMGQKMDCAWGGELLFVLV